MWPRATHSHFVPDCLAPAHPCIYGRTVDEQALDGVADAREWLRGICRGKGCSDLRTLALAIGLTPRPIPVPGARARRFGGGLFYDLDASEDWIRAFLTREIARYVLERCGLEQSQWAVAQLSETIRQCVRGGVCQLAEEEASTSEHAPIHSTDPAQIRPRRVSEHRLRLGPAVS